MAKMIVDAGNNNLYVWKCEEEDFAFGTKLVVHESQTAVFLNNGALVETLGPGIHTLETSNFPFIKFFQKIRFGRYFHCQVYFINNAMKMAQNWGIRGIHTYLQLEPGKRQPLTIGASGRMNLQIDSDQVTDFVTYVLGAGKQLTNENVKEMFESAMNMIVKSHLAHVLEESEVLAFSLDKHLEQFSRQLQARLEPEFRNYGILLHEFMIENFALPEHDPAFQEAKLLHMQRYVQHGRLDLEQEIGKKKAMHETSMAQMHGDRAIIDAQTEAAIQAIRAKAKADEIILTADAHATRRSLENITSIQEHQFELEHDRIRYAAKQEKKEELIEGGKEDEMSILWRRCYHKS